MISSYAGSSRKSLLVLILGVILVLVLPFTVSCERKPVKLRWKLEQGKTYIYRSEVTGTWKLVSQEEGEFGGEFGNLLMTEMTVLEIGPDSAFKISESIDLLRKGQNFEPTVVTYSMAPNGKLYAMAEVDTGSAPRHIRGRERSEYRAQYFEQTQPTYPDRELRPGETWIQETKVVLDDRVITATNEFNVKGWEKVGQYLCLRIDYQSKAFIPYETIGKNLLDKVEVRGSIWFAPQEGLPVQQRDSTYLTTARIVPEGQEPPATYTVKSLRIYQFVGLR